MNILKYKDRIEHFDYLIRHNMTGTPKQCAKRLGMSKSSFYRFLDDLRLMSVPVKYNSEKECYEYETKGKVVFGFKLYEGIND